MFMRKKLTKILQLFLVVFQNDEKNFPIYPNKLNSIFLRKISKKSSHIFIKVFLGDSDIFHYFPNILNYQYPILSSKIIS